MHIEDWEFIRGDIPMTKQEIRAISIGKLKLEESFILIDVGAGTGSVGIEAATYLNTGKVFAIEKNKIAWELIDKNCEKFGIKNLTLIKGEAPNELPNIHYHRMFIGGSSGKLEDILKHFLKYSFENSIVVINIIALETLEKALSLLKKLKFINIEICNINVSRGEKIGNYTLMKGENPIYIITAKKGETWGSL